MSNILNALIEFKRKNFSNLQDVDDDKYYFFDSKTYINNSSDYSYVNLVFDEGASYTNCMKNSLNFEYNKIKNYSNIDVNNIEFKKNGFYRKIKESSKSSFDNNVFLYFPVDRYYNSKWLNKDNTKLKLIRQEKFLGEDVNKILKNNVLEDVEAWILDVIIVSVKNNMG